MSLDFSQDFPELNEDSASLETTLISILKRDDLKVKEIKIWDYIIKWEIAQNLTLPTIRKNGLQKIWALEITLQQCLLLIQYFHIPELFHPELPSRVNEQFLSIINKEHVTEPSSWIDRKSTIYSLTTIPYGFQLILGSRDGFYPKTFWTQLGCL
ncbi:hypothetical protein Glove_372g62 [Diversispora epigaea]|uniref:Uncharacterized protein n=1 Tax=Diversispora epigaea TaxID=1348612 RepID=A0A397HA87_9GLOM|nr:hypothetical protein Glove_372g62 [Diversispora epigaea]